MSVAIEIPIELQQELSAPQAWHYRIIPKEIGADHIELYIDEDQALDELLDELNVQFEKEVKLFPTDSQNLQKALSRYYRKSESGKITNVGSADADGFLEKLILEAKSLKSSDIHIEVYKFEARIRIRIDGHLVERYKLKKENYPALINRIKIKSNLDIAEKRLPQDGRISFIQQEDQFDIRVSILPTLYGEKVVMRLLNNDAADIDIERLGMTSDESSRYLEGIKKPHGIILISGPTGSGKTTTLYATLKLLNETRSNILTVEDPIEYTLEGINQVQLKEKIGLTFASALKTFLRQDPDVIMLGEIRDGETAEMAIRAALTGHLVLSTIHTNSAWGTISRLVDMGVPPFLLSNTLNTSVAQRLVRKLCTKCKTEQTFDEALYPHNFHPPEKIEKHFVAEGCDDCYYTGYKGRRALYEIIEIDRVMSQHIKNNTLDVTEVLDEKKISTLQTNAFEVFKSGDTSIEEVYAILSMS